MLRCVSDAGNMIPWRDKAIIFYVELIALQDIMAHMKIHSSRMYLCEKSIAEIVDFAIE